MKNRFLKIAKKSVSTILGIVIMCSTLLPALTSCKDKKKDSIVIMTDALSELFNPFYATAGTDMDVVGLTQIGMLSTDKNGQTVAGDEHATVVKDFEVIENTAGGRVVNTDYFFVIKNGLKFSDGMPLTMNDVLFNMYEYLDPVYTGSSTMYSIDIKGLKDYRLQVRTDEATGSEMEDQYASSALNYAEVRIQELKNAHDKYIEKEHNGETGVPVTIEELKRFITESHKISGGYKEAVSSKGASLSDAEAKTQLIADYDFALETFKKELESDYSAAQESFDFTKEPYKSWSKYKDNEQFKFLVYEGKIKPHYKGEVDGKIVADTDRNVIEKFDNENLWQTLNTKEKAIDRVYTDTYKNDLINILSYWGTAGTLTTKYTAEAKSILLNSNVGESLEVPNIEGIVSLGHDKNFTANTQTVNGKEYKIAKEHNADGTVKNEDEYDVLKITVNGVDPKAIYNFGFSVAPAHYYTADEKNPNGRKIDIKNNQFGVEYASSEFQTRVIQSREHASVPVGAGPYKASNDKNGDKTTGSEFCKNNMVYYKANKYFMFDVKCEKLCMQVVSSTNAVDKLANGEVDYITPQYTKENYDALTNKYSKKVGTLTAWQLGYGYIGINAGKVPNIYIRRAIMAAMNVELATQYYADDTCRTINWPMSQESWAYPGKNSDGTFDLVNNDWSYTRWTDGKNETQKAVQKVKELMQQAGVSAGDAQLKIKFTIAGASITEHPTYAVFSQAVEILNDCGWEVEVKADSQALTKLSTGSLAVWAAAWGSTIDPDMYQVYHKKSNATSVYAWGYREILKDTSTYEEENRIINDLSVIIEDARSTTDKEARKAYYKDAMNLVLELAVEMPVYQRMNLFAYNKNTVKGFPTEVNSYSSPLEKIWELELIKK